MKKIWKTAVSLLCAAALTLSFVGCAQEAAPVKPTVTVISVWTYYNGVQLLSFNQLVDEFNNTVGLEKNIIVESHSQGSVTDLEENVMEAALGKVGAAAMPNIFSAYADTAYALDQMGLLVDMSDYLSYAERAAFVDPYLDEGDFDGSGEIKIFPVAKSTELLFLNDTDWQAFAQDTGASYDGLATIEGLVKTAELYYQWTDAQTAELYDGKALFGRDAMANYFVLGTKQLGCTLFDVNDGVMQLNFPQGIARKLWDNYYVPFVKGWFSATGRFRSDDIKTGNILAYVGSSTSAAFFPSRVSLNDTESHDIALKVLPDPYFAAGTPVSVQQGAGMVVTTGTEAEVAASAEFLKWFARPDNNITFSVSSAYLPVTEQATDPAKILASGLDLAPQTEDALMCALAMTRVRPLYTSHAFKEGTAARSVLDYDLSDLASADRETVLQRIAEGRSYDEALAEFLSDEYFESWYDRIYTRLQSYAG